MAPITARVTSQNLGSDEYAGRSLGYVWDPIGLSYVVAQQAGASGGGGAVTVADGADVAQGATTDAEAAGNGSVVAILKRLRTLIGSVDTKTPALGQALAAASSPVVLTAIQQTALTPPAAITGFALEAGHLATIDSHIPAQGQALAAASLPVVLTAIQQAALTPPAAITGFALEAGHLAAIDTHLDVALSTRLKPADTLAAVTNLAQLAGTAPVMKAASTAAAAADAALVVGLSPNSPAMPKPSDLVVTATGAANAAVTATLPAAGAGLFHYITYIHIQRTSTAALTGSATLVITTTNLPGSLAWSVGNAMAIGATQNDVVVAFPSPIKSSAANSNSTIVAPAPGAAVLWRVTVGYYTGP